MNCHSKYNIFAPGGKGGFTLIEVIASLAVLTLITTAVLVVMNRYIEAAIDLRARMQAFELARENMENLLGKDSVQDTAEFGTSEINPDLRWETVVETFYEPITSRMWVQGVCSAGYTGSNGEIQIVELTCWLTDVTQSDLKKILEQEKREAEYLEELAEMDAFGDDADGLMMHAEYLTLTGDYEGAAEILEEIQYSFPESDEAAMAETMHQGIEEKIDDYQKEINESQDSSTSEKPRGKSIIDMTDEELRQEGYSEEIIGIIQGFRDL
jgi:prepilin-type N-terminal cleavage/methylation domain-containing protein